MAAKTTTKKKPTTTAKPKVAVKSTAPKAKVAAKPNTITIRSLKLLAVIYRGGANDKNRLNDQQVLYIKNALALGRLFYFRNTQCRLNLDLTYLVVDMPAPNTEGITYDYIVKDLQGRGIKNNQYDGIFCTGVGFFGNYGGFQVFGKTAAAFATCGETPDFEWWPARDPNIWYSSTWMIAHEFQHALDLVICDANSGHPEMLFDHPYGDSTSSYFTWGHRAAQHFDWVSHCLGTFKDYMDLKTPTNSSIISIDADRDGMPDNDPKLPMDEKRFGSDSSKKDTDKDGLNDLQEFCIDIFKGSDPRKTDTDSDGIPDGKDKNPTVAMAEKMVYTSAGPDIDGKMDSCYKPFTLSMYVDNSPTLGAARMSACWNEDALYLFIKSKTKCDLILTVDSSADNGYWEGGDTYLIKATSDGKVLFNGLGLGDGPVPGATAVWGTDGLEIKIPALIGQGVSSEINFGGKRRKQDIVDGMTLLAGRNISFNLMLQNGKEKALITPNHAMYDITLAKSQNDPPRPSLRFSQRLTKSATPTVIVTGCRPKDFVRIIDGEGNELGHRMGDGEVTLNGELMVGFDSTTGANKIVATVDNYKSEPITLVVDIGAQAPTATLSADGQTIRIKGEIGAQAELMAVIKLPEGGSVDYPISTIALGQNGEGSYKLSDAEHGFVGGYGVGKDYTKPLFWRVDPEINFDFQDGSPDPRIPNDGFCARWIGYLNVPQEGDYTFYLSSDDGSRLILAGRSAINNMGHHGIEEGRKEVTRHLVKGVSTVIVDYNEEDGWAAAHLEWSGPGITRTHKLPVTPVPPSDIKVSYIVRQTDSVGNRSASTPVK
jgi:hypothetical protein